MNKTATILTGSALLLLRSTQKTLEDVGAAIIQPARLTRNYFTKDEETAIEQIQLIQNKLREAEFIFGDLQK